jgi:hypothetical protein
LLYKNLYQRIYIISRGVLNNILQNMYIRLDMMCNYGRLIRSMPPQLLAIENMPSHKTMLGNIPLELFFRVIY